MTPAQQVRWEHYVDLLRVDLENLEEEGDLLGEESWLKVVLAVNAELTASRAIVAVLAERVGDWGTGLLKCQECWTIWCSGRPEHHTEKCLVGKSRLLAAVGVPPDASH